MRKITNPARMTKKDKCAPLPAAGAQPTVSAMVGGVSNRTFNPNEKKTGPRGSISSDMPAHVEGGFVLPHRR